MLSWVLLFSINVSMLHMIPDVNHISRSDFISIELLQQVIYRYKKENAIGNDTEKWFVFVSFFCSTQRNIERTTSESFFAIREIKTRYTRW
ncbi:hypothetical protein Pan153_02440 [Gimesia panareensis]|uniref:Uncharacterized protein n=1 Tax=Gimesia panareensis TaxID=2527978 RepID=A0A518FH10_9PLAN|nr:hypothetical protein Pan153_02440 [Gimesia panareensis]